MQKIIIVLICISALGFVLAIISALFSAFSGSYFMGIPAEAYSRTCNNLALIAIALLLWLRERNK
jgi:hypothetical protein